MVLVKLLWHLISNDVHFWPYYPLLQHSKCKGLTTQSEENLPQPAKENLQSVQRESDMANELNATLHVLFRYADVYILHALHVG